jgi:hypothetical protein
MRKPHDISAHDTLKDALTDVVLHSAVSPKAQADEVGESLSTVYRWGDANQPDCYPPITKIIPLTRCTGNLSLVRFFARRVDAVVVELREIRPGRSGASCEASIAAHMAQIVVEMGELAAQLTRSFANQSMSESEARRSRKECEDVVDRAATLMKYLESIEESHR